MWNYDNLFAEGNIVGFKHSDEDQIHPYIIYEKNDCMDYFNDSLYYKSKDFISEIQYIIRLDEHGNVVEKLFDRERDMKTETKPMPELETGMFVRVTDNTNMTETVLGYVDITNCRIIYQDGKYNDLSTMEKLKGTVDIIEVYSRETNCFNRCFSNETLIWRSPEYQTYLDTKVNL